MTMEQIEKIIFNMYKEDSFKSMKELKNKIKNQFHNINDKMLKELCLEIYNYQILKYGNCLYQIPNGSNIGLYKSGDIRRI